MNVVVDDDIASSVAQLIERGAYVDAQDVVNAALRQLLDSDAEYQERVRTTLLARLAQTDPTGVEASRELAARIKREGRELLAQRRKPT